MSSRPSPTPVAGLRAAWRTLRTMRTAIILLLMLAAGAAVGSAFPQRPIGPDAVDRWIARNPGWAPVAEKLGLFDVFGSWWFMLIYGLLLVSLVGCLIPRYRVFGRALRARPKTIATLAGQPQYTAGNVAVDPDAALARAARVLRGRRFRLTHADGTLAAEKGNVREGGSLVFHTAFLVLLVGMSVGKFFGFTGQVAVVEGARFVDTHLAYDSITEGRLFNERHRGFSVVVDDFEAAWWPNGVPREFVSNVRVFDHDRLVRGQRIAVNSPLTYRGVRLYQLSWGWAPRIRVSQRGRALYDGPTVFLPKQGLFHGVVKLPQTNPQQTGLDMFFFSDVGKDAAGNAVNRSPQARNPFLFVQPYAGDLGLSSPQSVYQLDLRGLSPLRAPVGIPLGGRASLPNGIEVSFPELKQYTVFEVASNPGAPILLIASILILAGLVPSLYGSRRRVWVRAIARDGAARLEIAGHALQRKGAFEEEFKMLVRTIDRDLHTLSTSARREPADVSGATDA